MAEVRIREAPSVRAGRAKRASPKRTRARATPAYKTAMAKKKRAEAKAKAESKPKKKSASKKTTDRVSKDKIKKSGMAPDASSVLRPEQGNPEPGLGMLQQATDAIGTVGDALGQAGTTAGNVIGNIYGGAKDAAGYAADKLSEGSDLPPAAAAPSPQGLAGADLGIANQIQDYLRSLLIGGQNFGANVMSGLPAMPQPVPPLGPPPQAVPAPQIQPVPMPQAPNMTPAPPPAPAGPPPNMTPAGPQMTPAPPPAPNMTPAPGVAGAPQQQFGSPAATPVQGPTIYDMLGVTGSRGY